MKHFAPTLLVFQLAVTSVLAGCGQHSGSIEWQSDTATRNESTRSEAVQENVKAWIDSPRDGQVITSDIFDDFSGTVSNLPQGQRLFVFARDRYGWYLQFPPVFLDADRGTFCHRNIRLTMDTEDWELHLCVSTAEASSYLESRARRSDWAGVPVLPDGVTSVARVAVLRQRAP